MAKSEIPCNYSVLIDLRLFRLNEEQLHNLGSEFYGYPSGVLSDEQKLFSQKIKMCFEQMENVKLFLSALACFALEGDGDSGSPM